MMWLLAHQGGWDELLMFAVPAVLAVLGLRWAEKRARARAEKTDSQTSSLQEPPPALRATSPSEAGGGKGGRDPEGRGRESRAKRGEDDGL